MNTELVNELKPSPFEPDPYWSRETMVSILRDSKSERVTDRGRKWRSGAAILGLTVVVGGGAAAFAGAVVVGYPSTDTQTHSSTAPPSPPVSVSSPLPEATLTPGAIQPGSPAPDLVEGFTNDGRPGYIRTYDLANLKAPAGVKSGALKVKVYEADGQTVIGEWTASTFKQE